MTHTDSPFPIVLRERPRRAWLLAVPAFLLVAGGVPVLGIAQASRQQSAPVPVVASDAASLPQIVDRPATITLGALIEEQRRARAQQRAIATGEQIAAELPPGETWQAQFGAFSNADAAERQRAQLVSVGMPVVVRRDGALHRLQSLPAQREETEGLCARAQSGGIDCFVRQTADKI